MTEEQYTKIENLVEASDRLTEWGPVGEEELDKVNFKDAAQFRRDYDALVKATKELRPILEALR